MSRENTNPLQLICTVWLLALIVSTLQFPLPTSNENNVNAGKNTNIPVVQPMQASMTAQPAQITEDAVNTLPDDPLAIQQWNHQSEQQFTGASGLFAAQSLVTSGSEVVVAIVDSGVLVNHEDLHFLPGFDFIDDPKVSNDGDGRDHDPTDPGDWVNNEDLTQQRVSENCSVAASTWHGTAMAGIIGATSHNATGIAGGAPLVALLPVRVTGKCGGYIADLIDGIRWSAGLTVEGVADNQNPADVINLSVGFPGNCSNAVQTAINDAVRAGSIVVTAATNSAASLDIEPYSPAVCNNVITVAATDRAGSVTAFSALGDAVTLSAPGGTIRDGIITTQNNGREAALPENSYGYQFGTSIAAAHVSATVATLLSYQPDLSKDQVEQLLRASATSTANDERCTTQSCGFGRLNADAAIQMLIANTPFEPDDLTDESITLSDEPEPVVQTAQANNTGTELNQPAATASTDLARDTVVSSITTGGSSGAGIADFRALLLLLFFSYIRRLAQKPRTRKIKIIY